MRYGVYVQADAPTESVRPAWDVLDDIGRVEAAGYESAWIMDHLFIHRRRHNQRRTSGHDPLVVLAAAAARKERIGLGTLVLADPLRPIWQTAREAAALADVSLGRFILGIGAGGFTPELDAFGIPSRQLVARFEERLPLLKRLLGGAHVTHTSPHLTLCDAEVLSTAPPPPIWVGATGPRMLRLTARVADGWNVWAGSRGPGAAVEPLARLRHELEAAGRDPATLTTSAGVSLPPGSGTRDVEALVRGYEATGIDMLILSFAAHPGGEPFHEGIERVASILRIERQGLTRHPSTG
jgi:alkanesulfonate monooxygenase SsuD/methylene tetrahydromethanopterin reductase-like flavin-dependent oxidoreductase (luciferase family)